MSSIVSRRSTGTRADLGDVLPEGVLAGRQRLDVVAVLEQHAHVALLDGERVEHAIGHRRTHDHLEILVLEADLIGPGVDHLDGHLAERGPVGVQARRQHVAEAAVDPDQRPLVVLQVEHDGAVLQRARAHDHVELLVGQPRRALRNDLDLDLAERVEEPVATGAEQALELAVAEVEAHFVAANLDSLQHRSTPFCGRCDRCLGFTPAMLAKQQAVCECNVDSCSNHVV